MAVTALETFDYITASHEHPLPGGDSLRECLQESHVVAGLPPIRRILIGGSGLGREVFAFGKFYKHANPQIVALDRHVALSPDVVRRVKTPIEEQRVLLHEYLLSKPEHFEIIVINTGRVHGIREPEEFEALSGAVSPHGVIFMGPDSLLYDYSMLQRFDFVDDTEIPQLPTAWLKR